jgi:uncharacterized membrane protein (UPF0127 family)
MMICGGVRKESSSFLKKRSKRLVIVGARLAGSARPRNKSFLVLFFKKERLFSLAFALVALPLVARAQEDLPTTAQPTLPMQSVTIVGKSGARHVFKAEVATTDREQQVGEMFRTNIPADQGMFFDWRVPREMTMWMKNCPVPEDMVFIGADGVITHIAENTVPESEGLIPSGGPVRATLELQGGITAKLGIEVGDRVSGVIFPAIK